MKYYLYILKTLNNTLYCGIAINPIERFKLHLKGKGAKYTKANKPEKIVYLDVFDDKNSALKEEYRIKKTLSKIQKLNLIENNEQKTSKLLKEFEVAQ